MTRRFWHVMLYCTGLYLPLRANIGGAVGLGKPKKKTAGCFSRACACVRWCEARAYKRALGGVGFTLTKKTWHPDLNSGRSIHTSSYHPMQTMDPHNNSISAMYQIRE